MSEIATQPEGGPTEVAAVPQPPAEHELVRWAHAARQARGIAESLASTSFVPRSLQGNPGNIIGAILAGYEMGLQPMAALRSIDIIQGTPALRAHAMRGLVQSRGHQVQLVESGEAVCVMRGRRKGDEEWQEVVWTIERAQKLGLLVKDQWKKQPTAMLVARATGEICRLVASDVLHAMPYAREELESGIPTEAVTRIDVREFTPGADGAGEPRTELDPSDTWFVPRPADDSPDDDPPAGEAPEPMIDAAQKKELASNAAALGLTLPEGALTYIAKALDMEALDSIDNLSLTEAGLALEQMRADIAAAEAARAGDAS